jgi:hypothetical protein
MALTTVPNCKAFRNIEGDNQEHDAELERLIPAVQAFLEQQCGRTFEQATATEYYHGAGSGGLSTVEHSAPRWRSQLLVARPPIVSVTSLYDDPLRVYGASTLLAASSYVVADADAGLIILDGLTFQQGLRNIKITYVGGYATIPTDLEQAAIELVWACREKGANNLVGVRSRSVADGNVQYVNLDWGGINLAPIINKYSLRTGVA